MSTTASSCTSRWSGEHCDCAARGSYSPLLSRAFDTSRLAFVWDGLRDAFVAHVLDPEIMDVRLVDKAREKLGARFKAADEPALGDRRFRDVHLRALVLPFGFMPWRRCLCLHAHMARDQAARMGWLPPFDFEDFWSEGTSGAAKVQLWLSAHAVEQPFAEETETSEPGSEGPG